jgi:hypothetical protein
VDERVVGVGGAGGGDAQRVDQGSKLGLDGVGVGVVGCQALDFNEGADAFEVIDAQGVVADGGDAAGLRDADGGAVAHVQGGVVHGLAVGDFGFVLDAGLGVAEGLLEGEVVASVDRAQAQEGDAELAVAELPGGGGVCLVVLVDRVAQLDAAGLEGGLECLQVIDAVLDLDLAHPGFPSRGRQRGQPRRSLMTPATRLAGSADFVTWLPKASHPGSVAGDSDLRGQKRVGTSAAVAGW